MKLSPQTDIVQQEFNEGRNTDQPLPEIIQRLKNISVRSVAGESISVSDEAFFLSWRLFPDPIHGDQRVLIEQCFTATISEIQRLGANYNEQIVDRYLDDNFPAVSPQHRTYLHQQACMGWNQRVMG